MLIVETVARIRREFFVKGKAIKEIVRDLGVSRNTVRKVLRSDETAFAYERSVQPLPKLGPWSSELDGLLEANGRKARRERLTMVRVFEELQGLGYRGGYDAVRRYAAAWHRERSVVTAAAYVLLRFAPGEAYQFDWSHEVVIIAGATTTVKVAHVPAGKLDERCCANEQGRRACPLREYRTKPEIAIEEIDRVIAAGVRFGCVLTDAGYGLSAPFRQALSARGLCWAVGIPRHQKVYPADVQLIFPVAGRGRPRVRHVPEVKSFRTRHARRREVASGQLAQGNEGAPGRALCRSACAHRRRSAPADRCRRSPAHAGRGCLAGGRASLEWRTQILSLQPACRHPDQGSGRRDQGALDMRASPSATQGRTRPGPLRGPILDRAPPPRLDDDDGLCLPAKPPDRSGGTEKKSPRPAAATHPASSAPSHS